MWGAEDSLKAVPRKCLKLTLLAFAFSWGVGGQINLMLLQSPAVIIQKMGVESRRPFPVEPFLSLTLGG